jgi:ribonucleoside-diphosphate reductase alpha chain
MRDALSEFKLQSGYLKFQEDLGRKETWGEAVERVMNMHKTKYGSVMSTELSDLIDFAEHAYFDKLVLGSQRALQFGGDPILKKNSKMYNCLTSYCDRVEFFRQAMWWLLSGCGVGFSVLPQYISKLPTLKARELGTKTYVIEDTIEGWANGVGCLLASFFGESDQLFSEFYGYDVKFDFSQIRGKGAPISSGFRAPGPEPLMASLNKIEELLLKYLGDSPSKEVTPILAYDIVMHASNAVLAGGVRRSATICIFGKDDKEMLNAKTGNWYIDNPQRARSNNSVALLKNETSWEEFNEIMSSVKQFGEPGFVWLDDLRIVYNPCVEIGMVPALFRGTVRREGSSDLIPVWESGWQGCNLTEINGAACKTREDFLRACRASAILGTLQAGYTTFDYVGRTTEEIFRKESLLGCSITGWMNNPEILFNAEILAEGVALIKQTNEEVAKMLGINPAARLTCSKPSGNAAVILGCASGMKPEEAKRYIRYVQVNPDEYGVEQFKRINPELFEASVWDANGNDYAIGFAVQNDEGVLLKSDVYGVKHLEYVKRAMEHWVQPGTITERCTIPSVRHNISATINVDDWDEVAKYIYENKQYFAGISLLGMDGSLEYNQAPFTEVLDLEQLTTRYGDGVMLASGLIVDGLHAFENDLWTACMYVQDHKLKLEGSRQQVFLKKDWIRRAKKFARNYFRGNLHRMTYCLKDVHRFYRFNTIKKSYKPIDWVNHKEQGKRVDIDTMGAVACSGGACEVVM